MSTGAHNNYVLAIETWAGRRTYPVEIVRETRTRYCVRALMGMTLPGGRYVHDGVTALVPKYAVREGKPSEQAAYRGHIYGYGN